MSCMFREGGYVFTSPALVVSPEVNADQRRGALLLPAGLWRAAAGDSLWSDHLQPVWRLLPAQRDGVSIKPQISHTSWVGKWRQTLKAGNKTHSTLFNTQFESVMCKFSFYIQGASGTATGSRGVLLSCVSLHSQLTVKCSYQSLYSIICGGKYWLPNPSESTDK